MVNSWNKLVLLLLLVTAAGTMAAQVAKQVSPFSRLGLGDFRFQNTITTLGMGGTGAAFSSPYHINLANPASLGSLRTAAFEAGVFIEQNELTLGEETATSLNGNLNYLSLGFSLQNLSNQLLERKERKINWGMNFALLPYTSIGYDIRFFDSGTIEGQDSVQTRTEFIGSGGTNKVVWSNGVRYKNFSAGVTLGVLFGNLENSRKVNFLNIANPYTSQFSDNININGFIYDLGVQYEFKFNQDPNNPKSTPKQSLKVGIVGHGSTGFTTKTSRVRSRINPTPGYPGVLDTIQSQIDVVDKGTLPAEVTLGFVFRHKAKFLVSMDYTISDWSNYENPAQDFGSSEPTVLYKSSRIAGGLQWTPDATSYNSYLKRVAYRIGGYHFDDPRQEDIKTYALTFGAGFPIVSQRRTSFLNLAVELGNQVSDSIDTQFWRINLGFTLNDNSWFFKRKFN